MNANREIQTLSQTLKLADGPQDWGIMNSDPSRIEEFIRFRETAPLTSAQQFAMGELVFASMNDALIEGIAVDDLERFLGLELHGLLWHVRYWSSLGGEEFPIAALLRRLAIPA